MQGCIVMSNLNRISHSVQCGKQISHHKFFVIVESSDWKYNVCVRSGEKVLVTTFAGLAQHSQHEVTTNGVCEVQL